MNDPVDAPGRRHSASALWFWALLAMACVVPVAGLVVTAVILPDEVPALNPPARPVLAEVREIEVDGLTTASAQLTWIDGSAVTAPAWAGLTTSVAIKPGQILRTGSTLLSIDGVDRLAVWTPRPFHRSLASGDSGSDVAMLRNSLRALGYKVKVQRRADHFGQVMVRAVRQLETKLAGTPLTSATGVFQPAWFGWLPTETLTVHEVKVEVGRPAPGVGEPIAVGAPKLALLKVSVADSVRLRDAPYEFVHSDATVTLADGLTAQGDALAELSAVVPPGLANVDGHLRLVETARALVVPVTAVQSAADGRLCLHLAGEGGYMVVGVTVAGGGIGMAEVASGVSAGDQVLANPGELGRTCD